MSSENLNFPLDSSQYELQHVIGRGATSSVYVAKCLSNNKTLAIKLINLEAYPLEIEFLRQEVAFWSSTQLPQVVRYYGSFVSGPMLYILMEYMAGGSVSDIIRYSYPKGFKDEKIIATILFAILKALSYIHSHDELHRDVKPGNALIGEDGQVKIADFGVAATLHENGQRKNARYTVIGTPCYMAPEILKEETGYTQKADIWSFGITAIELATGQAPYSNLPSLAVVQKVLRAPPPILTTRSGEHSAEICQVIKACLNHDPTKRPTADELLQMPFFSIVQPSDYLKDMLISKIPTLEKRYATIQAKSMQFALNQENGKGVKNNDFHFDFGDEVKPNNVNPVPQQQPLIQILLEPKKDAEKDEKDKNNDSNPINNNFPLNNFGLNVIDFTTDNNKLNSNNNNFSSNITSNSSFNSNININSNNNSNISNSILNGSSNINAPSVSTNYKTNQPEGPSSLGNSPNQNTNEQKIQKGRFHLTKKPSNSLTTLPEENIKLQSNSSANSNPSTGSIMHSSDILIPSLENESKQRLRPNSNYSSYFPQSASLPQSATSRNLPNKSDNSESPENKFVNNHLNRNLPSPQRFKIDTGNNVASPTKNKPIQNNTNKDQNINNKSSTIDDNTNNENLFEIVQKLINKTDKLSEETHAIKKEVQDLYDIVQSLPRP